MFTVPYGIFCRPYGAPVTNQYITSLIASFPWLTQAEAAGVAEQLGEADRSGSAAELIGTFAFVLDRAGLPPTSTLLLNLAGRGSKKTAVDVARNVARARFERARQLQTRGYGAIGAAPAVPSGLNEAEVRAVVRVAMDAALAMRPNPVGGGDAVVVAAGVWRR